MAPAHYAPLPNPRSEPDAVSELDQAFGSEYDEADELHANTHAEESTPFVSTTERRQPFFVTVPGTYDFERDYDYDRPPPGSPPVPTATARPNDHGNSNGVLPESPARPPVNRPSFFRRVAGALLPQHYQRVPSEPTSSVPVGAGIDNDGVFANVTAKPGRTIQIQSEDGNVHMVPEDSQKDTPPSYTEAQADAVPGYWETTVHVNRSMDPNADMIVEDLPTGSVILFCANTFISYFFNFVGFVLTYLLHTTHAAKYGSRAGLGLSLIQYGFYARQRRNMDDTSAAEPILFWNTTTGALQAAEPVRPAFDPAMFPNGTMVDGELPEGYDPSSRDWLAFLLMTLGWFLLLTSVVGFYRVKRWESSIRSANTADQAPSQPSSPEDQQRELELRRNLERAFLMPLFEEDGENEHRRIAEPGSPPREADVRLATHLRAAGFI